MRLNQASDFALRILMFLAEQKEPQTVEKIANRLLLVKSHVMKIVAKLVRAEILLSTRGRYGGVSLANLPSDIFIGDVVRAIESDFAIVECMQDQQSTCVYLPNCKLRNTMSTAQVAFMKVLDEQDLQSLVA